MNRNIELKLKHHHHGLKSCIHSNSPGGWKIKREVLHQFSNVILGSSHFDAPDEKCEWRQGHWYIYNICVIVWLQGCWQDCMHVCTKEKIQDLQNNHFEIYFAKATLGKRVTEWYLYKMESMSWRLSDSIFSYPIALLATSPREIYILLDLVQREREGGWREEGWYADIYVWSKQHSLFYCWLIMKWGIMNPLNCENNDHYNYDIHFHITIIIKDDFFKITPL